VSQDRSAHAGWGTSLNVFYCPHCQSAHLAAADTSLTVCPACLQGKVSPQPERMRREPPELAIPFAVGEERVNSLLSEWLKGIWFRPADLRADLLLERIRRYYWPLWLADSDVEATWQAEVGYDYQAASFQERYEAGRWASQQVTETRIRWEPRVGRLKRHYDNVVVPALEEHERWMARLGGYDYRTRRPYSPNTIAQSVVRVPDHPPEAAWSEAEVAFGRMAAIECKVAIDADHVRNWAMRAEFQEVHWTQMLVPAYVTYYREGDGVYPVWMNGQSGRVYGVKRMSQRKATIASLITGAVALSCFLIGLLLTTVGVGVVLVVLSFFVGALAPVPAIWAWLNNRQAGRQVSEP
jgi:hypothetical protein